MLAGGTEAGIHEPLVGGFCAMRALSTRNDDPAGASRPFDQGRDGFVMGEGGRRPRPRGDSSMPRRAARRRSPSSSATARPPTRPTSRCPPRAASARSGRPGGPSRRRAWSPTRSTTSTPTPPRRPRATRPSCRRSGRSSATAPREVVDHGQQVACSATPSGAAGAIEAIATILALRDGCVPPTINLDRPGRGRRGPRPDAERRPRRRRHPTAPSQLVRVRRPEHAPSSSAGGTDDRRTRSRPSRSTGRRRPRTPRRPVLDPGDASLLALVDRLAAILERSDLAELEVEAGGTGLILRKPVAVAPTAPRSAAPARGGRGRPSPAAATGRRAAGRRGARPAVGQGAAHRHLLRRPGARLGAVRRGRRRGRGRARSSA